MLGLVDLTEVPDAADVGGVVDDARDDPRSELLAAMGPMSVLVRPRVMAPIRVSFWVLPSSSATTPD